MILITSLLPKGHFSHEGWHLTAIRPGTTDAKLDGLELSIFWQLFEYEHIHISAPIMDELATAH